jgi:RNase P subunit RPR2
VAGMNIIRIMCPNLGCKRVLAVPVHARGKLVRCRGCGINIRIPLAKKNKDEPAAPPASEKAA